MPRIAVCESTLLPNGRHRVVNVIIAEVSDPCQDGCFHVDADNFACGVGSEYDPVMVDFVSPPDEPPSDEPADA